MDSIEHLIYDNNNDYGKFKKKIEHLIHDGDIEKLSKQLLFQPNMVLSLIRNGNSARPILSLIGSQKQYRMYELFLNCLFHFGESVLDEKEPDRISTIYDKDNNTNGKKSDGYSTSYDESEYPLDDRYIKIDANNKLFLQKYFNFSHGGGPEIESFQFWGLLLNRYNNDQKKALELVEIIMKSNYFNGVTSNSVRDYTVCIIAIIQLFLVD